jgi:hypothetical protein
MAESVEIIVNEVVQPVFISVDETAPPVYAVNGRMGYIFLDKNDVGLSNVENLSIIGVSGYLQNQISSLDLDYATDADLAIISGNLVASGSNLINLINSLSGYVANSDIYLSGYFQDSANYTAGLIGSLSGALNNSGQYLAYQIGDLANLINNASGNLQFQINNIYSYGFLTGFNSGDYVLKSQTGVFATKSELNASGQYLRDLTTGTSGNLQNQITNLNNNTGNYYPNTNPSGYINSGVAQSIFVNVTGDNLSGPLGVTTVIFSGGGYLQFKSGNPAWQEGRVFYDADSHSLSYYNDASDVTVNVGQEQIVRVSNGWTGTIANGSVVYISGAQGNRPSVYPASASNSFFHTHDILGVATHDINTQGYVTINGIVNGLNTNSYSPGDTLYLSNTSGQFTNIYPAAPTPAIKIGIVTRQHTHQGSIFVKIDNGQDLSQSHDVYLTNLSNGDILRYNSASGVWTNSLLNTGIFATISSLIATGEHLSNNISIISGNLESTGLFLSQQINSLSGNLVNNFATKVDLSTTGVNLQEQLNNLNKMALAYAIAL